MKTHKAICEFEGQPAGRLDRVVQRLTGMSRAGVRGLFDHGCVMLNGRPCDDSATIAAAGDTVEVSHDPKRKYKEKVKAWHDPAAAIVFEDDHLLVVDKSAHVLTVPTGKRQTNTLVHALQRYLAGRGQKKPGAGRAFVVHRLDRGVSGLLVFGKTLAIASRIKDQFAARKPQRLYLAVVKGRLAADRGTFSTHLATDANLNRYSTEDTEIGELAITHYEVIHRLKDVTVVQVRLETGRRNQIRVHFAEDGHPVLGDPRYPREHPGSATHPKWRTKRLALHAAVLGLTHPITGKRLQFESKAPVEFEPFMGRDLQPKQR